MDKKRSLRTLNDESTIKTAYDNESDVDSRLLNELSNIKGRLTAKLFDRDMNLITEVEIKDLITVLGDVQPPYVVLDGIVTQRLIDSASKSKVSYLVGIDESDDIKNRRGINIITKKTAQKGNYRLKKKSTRESPVPPRLRFDILKRDNFTCQYCGKKSPDVELEVDHIEPYSKTEDSSPENLITSCKDCNRGKRTKDVV